MGWFFRSRCGGCGQYKDECECYPDEEPWWDDNNSHDSHDSDNHSSDYDD